MGISSLATRYQFENFGTKWSGTRTNAQITTVVVHHQAGTNFNSMPEIWRNVEASAHYGIGPDGTIRAYIDENKIAWHANRANNYSIGIECTNTTGAPNWQVSEKTIDSLVRLIQDIEKRLGKKVAVIGHRDAPGAATVCPGPFLYSRLGTIRNRVNQTNNVNTVQNQPQTHDQIILASPPKTVGNYVGKLEVFNELSLGIFRIGAWLVPINGAAHLNQGYVFWMDADNPDVEIGRCKSAGIIRDDVNAAYGLPSGLRFGLDGTLDIRKFAGKRVFPMLRRTNDPNGNTINGQTVDIRFPEYVLTIPKR
ncbi:peptidoglycan recognition protein family protein [Enterococcus pernyi]|uniref:peptidoglycan recognition protein family protein n=1 Tax=Enterococcus pernyi TaxID=590158 RepID=UPI000A6B5AEE|nr:peptidoglycan recognition family protein [Enterococcus pernyi]